MKTIVLQSFRDYDVPSWITTSMNSVRTWAESRKFDYVSIGDEFFDYAPAWVRERCGMQIFPVTDIARLNLLKDYQGRGYNRVVWVDADVLVFNANLFDIDVPSGYAFSRELMMGEAPDGQLQISKPSINNAVMLFEQGNPMLDFYLFASENILRQTEPGKVARTALGPSFLRELARIMPLARLNCVGLFTPVLMKDLAEGGNKLWPIYKKAFRFPIGAANLCHFTRHHAEVEERLRMDVLYQRAVKELQSIVYGES